MLRVLIADDEERICQLIIALGEWTRLELEVVGTAENGPAALELVRTLTPDILITDIRMPGCDGLKLVEEAHKLIPELEVIVISGYAQFDYAQTAIRFGVGEYLLKP
ncbi:MAG: response regulator, partial [Eubacteriales bacterium]|nr:response regulator [Eubacteriales bacterium]